jgi:hypothetical protein
VNLELDDALAIANIMLSADGECVVCAADLLRQFAGRYPEAVPAIRGAWGRDRENPDGWRTA